MCPDCSERSRSAPAIRRCVTSSRRSGSTPCCHLQSVAPNTLSARRRSRHGRAALRRLGDSDTSRLRCGALAVLAEALAEQGEFEPAQATIDGCAVDPSPTQQQALSHARARAWLAQGEFERAYAELRRVGL